MTHLGIELFHADEIQSFEAVSRRRNKVKTDVNPAVSEGAQLPADLQFFLKIALKLRIYVIDDCLAAFLLVDLVSVSHCLYDSYVEFNVVFNQFKRFRHDLHFWMVVG